ncbi:rCG36842 [Rattus norvegicus]|uniref:RCG36842 n=1 Tax=Rattus norvegicus TaxID=10116 RepID=A6HUH7_RAT|nr:rCG36842 [Rattus norvegicus]
MRRLYTACCIATNKD